MQLHRSTFERRGRDQPARSSCCSRSTATAPRHARRADRGAAAAGDPRGRAAGRRAVPSTRDLARQLGVSRRVAVDAYAQLAAEGYLSLRQGARPRVAEGRRGRRGAGAGRSAAAPRRRATTSARASRTSSAFPRAAWLRCAARRGADDHRRRPRLRRPARRRRAARGARGLPRPRARRGRRPGARRRHERLHRRASGSSAARSRRRARRGSRSRTRATPSSGEIAARAGLEPVPVAGRRRRASGSTRSARRRRRGRRHARAPAPDGRRALAASGATALLAWLREPDAIAIEDDYDAEYRYDRAAVGALQGLEPERVVYAGSASKTLAPALRLGWLVVPARAAGRRRATRRSLADRGPPGSSSTRWRTSSRRGELDRHLRRMRARYRARRDALDRGGARRAPRRDGQRHRRRAAR